MCPQKEVPSEPDPVFQNLGRLCQLSDVSRQEKLQVLKKSVV